MKSPEMGMDDPKESPPKAEVSVEATPLSKELKDAMREEQNRLNDERSELQKTVEEDFATIVDIESDDTNLNKADFKGVEQVRDIFEKYQNVPAVQKALKELAVPLLLQVGTLGKIKRFADSPGVNKLVAIDNRLEELRKTLSE